MWDFVHWSRGGLRSRGRSRHGALVASERTFRVRHVLKNGLVVDVEIIGEVAELDGTAVWLAAARDVTAYLDLESQLKHQALYDELTALPNGVVFVDLLEQSLRHLEVARRVLRSLDEPFLLPGARGVTPLDP